MQDGAKIDFLQKKAGQLAHSKKARPFRDKRLKKSKDARRSWRNDGGW